jgi:hypothetical protein
MTPPDRTTARRGDVAEALAEAVDALGLVSRTGGDGVEIATHYAGGKVLGVKLTGDRVTIHVVAERLPLGQSAEAVHATCRSVLERFALDWPVELVIDDLDVDGLPSGRVQ